MKPRALRWIWLVGLTPILVGTTSRSEIINHGPPPAAGNGIPKSSQAICPGVPSGVALIEGLRTGWAVEHPQSGNVELMFSDLPLACQNLEDLGNEGIGPMANQMCVNAWAFALTLPPEMQNPGVYNLPDHKIGVFTSIASVEPARGCSGACSGGGFTAGSGITDLLSPGQPGTLEIYSITDQCITGRVQGLFAGLLSAPPTHLDGAFHAVRCAATAAAAGDP